MTKIFWRAFALSNALICASSIIIVDNAYSDDRLAYVEVLLKAANDLCTTVSTKGSATSAEVRGDIQLQLRGLAALLTKSGVKGAGEIKGAEFENVLQQELANTIRSGNECRLKVLDALKDKIWPDQASSQNGNVPTKTPSDRQDAPIKTSLLGEWGGPVNCKNGQAFSMKLSINKQIGETAIGDSVWSGSNSGRAVSTLSPNPSSQELGSYLLVSDRSNVYKYALKMIRNNKFQGNSLGREQCDISLERENK